jgi:phage baseplate assembly protein W
MPFGENQIFPLDLSPSIAVGIDLPLNGPGVFKPNYQTKDAIKSSLINFLLTNPGERFLNPTFGAGLRDFLFSQLNSSNLDFLESDIQSKINTLFPNISITSLEVLRSNDHTIIIKFSYRIINTNLTDEITLSFT